MAGLSTSTVHRLLATLTAERILEHDAATGTYNVIANKPPDLSPAGGEWNPSWNGSQASVQMYNGALGADGAVLNHVVIGLAGVAERMVAAVGEFRGRLERFRSADWRTSGLADQRR